MKNPSLRTIPLAGLLAVAATLGMHGSAGATARGAKSAPSAVTIAADTAKATRDLRFVMTISMTNLPGDKVNPVCYSNVITRPAPPGWGAKGFLPSGSAKQARDAVEALKNDFIAACERSGRRVTNAGNFSWVWNQYSDGEERIANARAKHREDVSVRL